MSCSFFFLFSSLAGEFSLHLHHFLICRVSKKFSLDMFYLMFYLSSSCRLIVLSIEYFGMEPRTAAAQNMFVHVAVMSFEPIPQIPLELFFCFLLFLFVVLFFIIFIHMPLLGKHLSSIFRFGFPGFFRSLSGF